MEKVVQIDGKPVKLRATAGLPRLYRAIYGKDFFTAINKVTKNPDDDDTDGIALEAIENLSYVMARSADPDNIPPTIEEWLDSIDDPTAILTIAPDVIDLYKANAQMTAIPKKKKKRRRGK